MSIKMALVGNPNCGKTTMFNAMTGANQYVGNWPGVTVEKKEGKLRGYSDVVVTDLPGIYSLSPYTLEEVVSRDYLINERPDAILNLVDATNLERNLYLTTQVLEMGIPVVVALNMMDLVRKNGDQISAVKLSEQLGCPVVEVSALKGTGLKELYAKAVEMAKMMDVPVLGLVENMSYVKCPDCGREIHVFGESHIDEVAAKYGLKVLGKLPMEPKLAAACDRGAIELFEGDWLEPTADLIEGLPQKEQ